MNKEKGNNARLRTVILFARIYVSCMGAQNHSGYDKITAVLKIALCGYDCGLSSRDIDIIYIIMNKTLYKGETDCASIF